VGGGHIAAAAAARVVTRRQVRRGRLGWALGASAALHLMLAAGLLEFPLLLERQMAPPPSFKQATVEVVMGNNAEASGVLAPPPAEPAPPAEPTPPPPPAPPEPQPEAPAPPQTEAEAPPPPPPPQTEAEAPPPPPPPPQTEAEAPPPPPQTAAEAPPPPPKPPEKPAWQPTALLGAGTLGATEIVGNPLLPAVGERGNLPPPYPPLSAQLGEQGEVVVRMLIGRDGMVTAVEVLQTSGYSRLDEAAQAATARWRFTPAVRNGQAVESDQVLAIHFRLN